MGRNSWCVKQKLRKGLWSPEEDEKLYNYITRFGVGCWSSVPKLAGLQRCGKSCRLRWINYLRPDLKRGMFSPHEEDVILNLHKALGNRWAQIAAHLPGRTDNEIKNFWNSSLKKRLLKQGIDPNTHKPIDDAQAQQEGPLSSIDVPCLDQQTYHFSSKQAYDPLFLSELIQANLDSDGLESSFVSHCHQPLLRPYEQSQIENLHHPINPICGFNSMPNLNNFDHQNMPRTQCSHHSSPTGRKFVMNEGKRRSTVSFQQAMNDSNSLVENGGAFSWDDESKLDSVFQFSGIQIEERGQKLQNQNSEYSLTALPQNMDMFDHCV